MDPNGPTEWGSNGMGGPKGIHRFPTEWGVPNGPKWTNVLLKGSDGMGDPKGIGFLPKVPSRPIWTFENLVAKRALFILHPVLLIFCLPCDRLLISCCLTCMCPMGVPTGVFLVTVSYWTLKVESSSGPSPKAGFKIRIAGGGLE